MSDAAHPKGRRCTIILYTYTVYTRVSTKNLKPINNWNNINIEYAIRPPLFYRKSTSSVLQVLCVKVSICTPRRRMSKQKSFPPKNASFCVHLRYTIIYLKRINAIRIFITKYLQLKLVWQILRINYDWKQSIGIGTYTLYN